MKIRGDISIKISLFKIVCCLGVITYLKPGYFTYISTLDTLYNVLRIVAIVSVAIYYFIKRDFSKIIFAISAYYLLLLFVTYINNGNVQQAIINMFTVIAECMLFEMGIKLNQKAFLKLVYVTMSILIIANFITVLVFPNGITQNERGTAIDLLGIDNRFAYWFMLFICVSLIYSYVNYEKIINRVYFMYSICLGTVLYLWCAGAIIGIIPFIIYFIYIQNSNNRYLNFVVYEGVYLFFFIFITFSNLLEKVTWLTQGMLNKTDTLGTRVILWSRAKSYLSASIDKLLLGFGIENNDILIDKFYYVHVHNNLLNIVYQSGIIGTLIYLIIFILCGYMIMKYRRTYVAKTIAFSIFCFSIMLIGDTYDLYGHLLAIAVMGYNVQLLIGGSYESCTIYISRGDR